MRLSTTVGIPNNLTPPAGFPVSTSRTGLGRRLLESRVTFASTQPSRRGPRQGAPSSTNAALLLSCHRRPAHSRWPRPAFVPRAGSPSRTPAPVRSHRPSQTYPRLALRSGLDSLINPSLKAGPCCWGVCLLSSFHKPRKLQVSSTFGPSRCDGRGTMATADPCRHARSSLLWLPFHVRRLGNLSPQTRALAPLHPCLVSSSTPRGRDSFFHNPHPIRVHAALLGDQPRCCLARQYLRRRLGLRPRQVLSLVSGLCLLSAQPGASLTSQFDKINPQCTPVQLKGSWPLLVAQFRSQLV